VGSRAAGRQLEPVSRGQQGSGSAVGAGARYEKEDETITARRKLLDGGTSEALPAVSSVRGGLACADGEEGVQEEHPLVCPRSQAAVGRGGNGEVGVELAVDVAQGPGEWVDVWENGEGEALLPGTRTIYGK